MSLRTVGCSLLALGVLALTTAQPADAQVRDVLEDVGVRIHGGVILPTAGYGDHFNFGPSVGLDLAYSLNDRLNLGLDLDWEYVNTADIYRTPNTNLIRYRLGLEGDILGDQGSDLTLLRALAGVGFTTVRSNKFWVASRRPYTFSGESLNETALTATGGVRAGLRTPDGITWWLTGKLNWSPIDDLHQQALQELTNSELDNLSSALSFSLTLGVALR